MDRFGATVNASNPEFKRATVEWLSHLAAHPELRKESFRISEEATTSCEDRVSLSLNAMKQARLATDVDSGHYDHRLPELVKLARGMFRIDRLEDIARGKAALLSI